MNQLPFLKYQGCGNNFVILIQPQLANADLNASKWPALTQRLCQKHLSVGADGVLILERIGEGNVIHVAMFNPDGSKMGMCGNGARCVAQAARANGWFDGQECILMIESRRVACRLLSQHDVEVALGSFELELSEHTLDLDGLTVTGMCVSLGNPHFVIFTRDLDQIDLARLGPLIENHHFFPSRTNVEFAQIESPARIRVRVWERGAGITLACGSGAAATQALANARGLTQNSASICMPGGELEVRIEKSQAFLSGPARHVYSGLIELN